MSEGDFVPDIQPREHRAGAWVVLVIGVLGFGLGLYGWRSTIVNAFVTKAPKFKTLEQIEQEKLDEMKSKDTDSDGLNDFEESYVFKTSPYLNDSDSDGLLDKEELEAGKNPNCPEGRDCGPLIDYSAVVPPASDEESLGEAPNFDEVEQLRNLTPAQVRELLIKAGLKEEDLKGIDDETLMQMYQQSLQEADSQETQGDAAPQ